MEEQEFTIRERIAGYRALNELDMEERRKASIEERVRSFLSIISARHFSDGPSRDETPSWERWAKIRKRYGSPND